MTVNRIPRLPAVCRLYSSKKRLTAWRSKSRSPGDARKTWYSSTCSGFKAMTFPFTIRSYAGYHEQLRPPCAQRTLRHPFQQRQAHQSQGVEAHARAVRPAAAGHVVVAHFKVFAVSDGNERLPAGEVLGAVRQVRNRVHREPQVTAGLGADRRRQFVGQRLWFAPQLLDAVG